MKFWRWEKGRQNTGYEKLLLLAARWPIPFDLYLLRFREGICIPPHTDPVKSGRHYRLNIVVKKAKAGGEFLCDSPIYESPRIKYFHPDISEHSVSKVQSGTRYVLSLGWVRRS
ncbi:MULTISPECIES: hypothetical protein [unclassified Microbulbifer]|uniref:hypothetical protein n=1 Tax=unclassified Microbulbifer TaxID=2619833 RepID=UPI0027E45CFC|nr:MULTISPECIES: hypothetical protein [unclassified Microbulbifer]